MHKITVCPNYVHGSTGHEIMSILMRFPDPNTSFKLLVDNELVIIDHYLKKDDLGLIGSWISFLIDGSLRGLSKVTLAQDARSLSSQELAVEISQQAITHRKVVVDDLDDYQALSALISSHGIKLYDRANAGKAFDVPVIFDHEELTSELIRTACLIAEKSIVQLEDLQNDLITTHLRSRGYCVSDQTRAGVSASGKGPGELDLAIRLDNGVICSVIEALRLQSCGPSNEEVAKHIDKLVNKYDPLGVARNFIVVYAEATNFFALWQSYINYVNDINTNAHYDASKHSLREIIDVSSEYQCPNNIRVAKATHAREPNPLEIVHIFVKIGA